ncbi:type VI secretion system baseplate subunit TssE, partial [Rhodanobacter denitrificans]|nr:type VI secretion system baseplate subunit TssE [Rhodanobacter denitrificans]
MAELTTQERLQPSLLDRLTDDEPGKLEESREKRVISATRLRDCVTRDISWLLNCVNLSVDTDLGDYPEVSCSVLNFGIPDLTGVALSGINSDILQRQVRDAILAFEPRLTANTLRVTAIAKS